MTKTGLVVVIERSGSKFYIRRPGNGWLGESEQSGSKRLGGARNRGVSVQEWVIGEQGVREQVIGGQSTLNASDRGVIEINNTVRNE